MAIPKSHGSSVLPDQVKLTPRQASRLGAMSDVPAKELANLTVAEISDKFRFRVDPALLFFRKVCGKVVKKDPVTGIDQPVPYATVHVEDTDCSFLGFFPASAKWAWYFPFACHREVIATAKTDECGNFCVWVPRWDIDWIVRFRRERICYPVIFTRPSVRELLDELTPHRPPIPDPGPLRPGLEGDGGVVDELDRANLFKQVEDRLGRDVSQVLGRLNAKATFGSSNLALTAALDSPAFDQRVSPPLPKDLRVVGSSSSAQLTMDTARSSLAARLKLDPDGLSALDLRAFIGPFRRCFDVLIPEWVPLVDIPDITFRVTQDTDGNGSEEVIYSEGFFQVRWDAAVPGPITLQALPNARAGLSCGGDPVPCGNVPAIVLAGRLPVISAPTLYDAINGYSLRTNRPHPSGNFADPLPNPDAASPFRGAVSLLGCNKTDPKATHYRVRYKYSANGGATFTAFTPFVGLTWPLFRLSGTGTLELHYPSSDAQGWYPIALPAGPNPFLPQDLLLDWPTYAFANGRYVLVLDLGTGGVASSSSAEVAFNVDNSAPQGPVTVEWRKVGGTFAPLLPPCQVVRRGTTPADLEFRVTLAASALHLRSAQLFAGGCGSGNFVLASGSTEHWHTSVADNSVTLQAIFSLSAAAAEGTYSFSAHVASRAFNPNGGDGGHLQVPAWQYDPDDIHIDPYFPFSVINAN